MKSEFHLEVLPKSQLKVWNQINTEAKYLKVNGYYLAGGTALALQLGHRRSVDFDFFSRKPERADSVLSRLKRFPNYILRERDSDTVHAEISGVKLSFIGAYQYSTIENLLEIDGIRMASVIDIALMKLLAVTHRATLRDYIDLAAIIRGSLPLKTLLQKSKQKYGRSFNVMLPLKALVSFNDLDEEMPLLLDKSLASSWREILKQAVKRLA